MDSTQQFLTVLVTFPLISDIRQNTILTSQTSLLLYLKLNHYRYRDCQFFTLRRILGNAVLSSEFFLSFAFELNNSQRHSEVKKGIILIIFKSETANPAISFGFLVIRIYT
jgi:hypothetical protein